MKKQIVEVSSVSKEFNHTSVIQHINLSVNEGDIYGLLGANGAGKTTLLKIMTGFLEATEGSVTLLGHDTWKDRNDVLPLIGSLIETPTFYEHLTAKDNLAIHLAYMNKQADIQATLNLVGLSNVKDKLLAQFSLGMRQRLAIARAIIHQPKLLLLDEPINGLDPVAIKEMRELFVDLSKRGTTIIISSHILSEIELTVNRVGVIANGSLVLDDTMENLNRLHPQNLTDHLIDAMRGRV